MGHDLLTELEGFESQKPTLLSSEKALNVFPIPLNFSAAIALVKDNMSRATVRDQNRADLLS